jgi:hypothetical protein
MQLNNILLTETVAVNMVALILGLLIVRIAPISLKSFQAVYLLLGAANIGLHHFYRPDISLIALSIPLAAGIAIVMIIAGVIGKMRSSVHYETILVSVGLFPWYLGLIPSAIYILVSIILMAIIVYFSRLWASHSIHSKMMKNSSLKASRSKEDYEIFVKKSTVILTSPIGFGAIAAAIIHSIQ